MMSSELAKLLSTMTLYLPATYRRQQRLIQAEASSYMTPLMKEKTWEEKDFWSGAAPRFRQDQQSFLPPPTCVSGNNSHQGGRLILLVWVHHAGEVCSCPPVLQTLTDRHRVGGVRPSCRDETMRQSVLYFHTRFNVFTYFNLTERWKVLMTLSNSEPDRKCAKWLIIRGTLIIIIKTRMSDLSNLESPKVNHQ